MLIINVKILKNKIAVIIGAGPAGLTAAYELLGTAGYNPIVVERDKQVGGISKTVDYKSNKIDIGGHRFFQNQKGLLIGGLVFYRLKLMFRRKKLISVIIIKKLRYKTKTLHRGMKK